MDTNEWRVRRTCAYDMGYGYRSGHLTDNACRAALEALMRDTRIAEGALALRDIVNAFTRGMAHADSVRITRDLCGP